MNMNSRFSPASRQVPSTLATRAQLSPLTSRILRGAGERERPVVAPLPSGWNPRLLDELRAPLTRFHD